MRAHNCSRLSSICGAFPGAKKARRLGGAGSTTCETVVEEENVTEYEHWNKPSLCHAKSAMDPYFFNLEALTSTCTSVVTLMTSDEVEAPFTVWDVIKDTQKHQRLPSEPAAPLANCLTSNSTLTAPTPGQCIPHASSMTKTTSKSGSGW